MKWFPHLRYFAVAGAVLLSAGAFTPAHAQADPGDVKRAVARISLIDGDVSVRRGLEGDEHLIAVEVEADGFLYNMVRTIVGTLVKVGRRARSESWVAEVLAAADRRTAGPTAPPQGLFLVRVEYE